MKAHYCPYCGSDKVDGGLTDNQLIAIGIITIATFFLLFIPGIILYNTLKKANCINCSHKWKPTAESEKQGYHKNQNTQNIYENEYLTHYQELFNKENKINKIKNQYATYSILLLGLGIILGYFINILIT